MRSHYGYWHLSIVVLHNWLSHFYLKELAPIVIIVFQFRQLYHTAWGSYKHWVANSMKQVIRKSPGWRYRVINNNKIGPNIRTYPVCPGLTKKTVLVNSICNAWSFLLGTNAARRKTCSRRSWISHVTLRLQTTFAMLWNRIKWNERRLNGPRACDNIVLRICNGT